MAGRTSDNPFVAALTLVLDVAQREGFRVALIGGFALPFHGVQRATGDIDFLADAGVASHVASVDFIFARRARTGEMLARAQRHDVPETGCACRWSTPRR